MDGICDRRTWNALVEAGRVLGERLLFFRSERLRGEDIASLQRQLGALGFDAGRVDGIFGPQTLAALSDFQRNAGLVEDGICGPATIAALGRLKTRTNRDDVVVGVRERLWLQERPRTLTGRRVAVGEYGGLAVFTEAIRRSLVLAGAHAIGLHDTDPSAQAAQANGAGVDAYIGLELLPEEDGCQTVFFLGHNGFYSPAGRHLAELAHEQLVLDLKLPARGVEGLRLPILRQTRMPAIVVRLAPLSQIVQQPSDLAGSLTSALSAWAADPLPG